MVDATIKDGDVRLRELGRALGRQRIEKKSLCAIRAVIASRSCITKTDKEAWNASGTSSGTFKDWKREFNVLWAALEYRDAYAGTPSGGSAGASAAAAGTGVAASLAAGGIEWELGVAEQAAALGAGGVYNADDLCEFFADELREVLADDWLAEVDSQSLFHAVEGDGEASQSDREPCLDDASTR